MRSLWRIGKAFCMAAIGHAGQKDKAGRAYLWHLLTVAWMAYGLTKNPEGVVVGLLHDYYEDVAPWGSRRLVRWFGAATNTRLWTLTRLVDNTYEAYLSGIMRSADQVVVAVKLADLLHNTDPGRRRRGGNKELRRRYVEALIRLVAVRAEMGREGV